LNFEINIEKIDIDIELVFNGLIFNIDSVSISVFKFQYNEKLLNVFNVSMFLNFFNVSMLKFNIFVQKGRLNFFVTNITLSLKYRKRKIRLKICGFWAIFIMLFENIDNI